MMGYKNLFMEAGMNQGRADAAPSPAGSPFGDTSLRLWLDGRNRFLRKALEILERHEGALPGAAPSPGPGYLIDPGQLEDILEIFSREGETESEMENALLEILAALCPTVRFRFLELLFYRNQRLVNCLMDEGTFRGRSAEMAGHVWRSMHALYGIVVLLEAGLSHDWLSQTGGKP